MVGETWRNDGCLYNLSTISAMGDLRCSGLTPMSSMISFDVREVAGNLDNDDDTFTDVRFRQIQR